MLAEGGLAAGLGLGRAESPDLKPLIPDARAAAAESYKQTGIYPINHMVVVKDDLIAANPWLGQALFEAFQAAKQQWEEKTPAADRSTLSGSDIEGDPFPYGIANNYKALEAIIGIAHDQKILSRPFSVEEVFVPSTLKL